MRDVTFQRSKYIMLYNNYRRNSKNWIFHVYITFLGGLLRLIPSKLAKKLYWNRIIIVLRKNIIIKMDIKLEINHKNESLLMHYQNVYTISITFLYFSFFWIYTLVFDLNKSYNKLWSINQIEAHFQYNRLRSSGHS